jgi:hypothetical protein
MTNIRLGASMTALLAAAAGVVGAAAGGTPAAAPGGDASSAGPAPRTALVVDAALARDGRELIARRLRAFPGELRIPRTRPEALTDVRYLAARGYRVVPVGPNAHAAAVTAGLLP